MSEHIEVFKNVDVEWNRETSYLDIRDSDDHDKQLALLYVMEAD